MDRQQAIADRKAPQHDVIPPRLVKLAKRLAMLRNGQAYSITVWMPEDRNSEPVWSIRDLGKVENES